MNRKSIATRFFVLVLLLCTPMSMQGKRNFPMQLDDGDTPAEIRGYVEDSLTHYRLNNVSVTFLRNGKPLKFTRTKEDGTFSISVTEKQAGDLLQTTCMGYKSKKRRFHRAKRPLST